MYRRILLVLDGSKMAEQALPHAIAQARQFQAELVLLRVLEPLPEVGGMSKASIEQAKQQTAVLAREYLEGVAARTEEQGVTIQVAAIEGRPNTAILTYAETHDVDLVVLCSRGRSGLSRWLMGSVADRVVRGATVPVLLVRAGKEAA
jgi:nucleotide-binding universal stress UspA family protein